MSSLWNVLSLTLAFVLAKTSWEFWHWAGLGLFSAICIAIHLTYRVRKGRWL